MGSRSLIVKIQKLLLVLWLPCGMFEQGCSKNHEIEETKGEEVQSMTIEEVLKKHSDEWMSLPGVVGTAIGIRNEERVLKVLVLEKSRELEKRIPSKVGGYLVVIEETGEIRAR